MTREQIEELRRYHDEATAAVSCAGHDDGEWCEFCTALSKMATFAANNASALLAAAERALLLEDVLRAAKLWIGDRVRIGAPHGKREAELRAAIDRAEGRP